MFENNSKVSNDNQTLGYCHISLHVILTVPLDVFWVHINWTRLQPWRKAAESIKHLYCTMTVSTHTHTHTHSSITVQPHSELIHLYKPSLMGKRETRSIANPRCKSCTILSCFLQKSTVGRDSPNCCHLWIDLKLYSQYFCSICNIHSFSQDRTRSLIKQ